MKKIIEIILLLVIVFFTVILLIGWNFEEKALEIKTDPYSVETEVDSTEIKEIHFASPREIATLFGWKEKKKNTVQEVKPDNQDKVKSTSWIKYLGHIVTSNGEKYYFFKNNADNELFRLTIDSTNDGWELLTITDEGFILEYNEEKYLVKKE